MNYNADTCFNEFIRLSNRVWPGSITQVDPCENGIFHRSNVTKFLDSCSANGLPPEDLFLPDDLIECTSHGLARVARAIITLIKRAEVSASACPYSLPDGGNVNSERRHSLRKRPRIPLRARDPLPGQSSMGPAHVATNEPTTYRPAAHSSCPPSPRVSPDTTDAEVSLLVPPEDGAITHLTTVTDQRITPQITNQSTLPLTENQSTSHSKKSKSEKESFTPNQSTMLSTNIIHHSKDTIYSSLNSFTTNDSLTNQSTYSAGGRNSQQTNNHSGETSPAQGSNLSSPTRTRSYSLPTRPSSHSSQTRTRSFSGSPRSRTRLLSLPTRPRLHSLPTRTRLISLPTRTRLLSLPTRTRLLSLSTRTQILAPLYEHAALQIKDASLSVKSLSASPSSERPSISPSWAKGPSALQKSNQAQDLIRKPNFVGVFVPESPHPPRMAWWYRVFARLQGALAG